MGTMRTPAEDAALSAFRDAATRDEDLGYPHGAAFVPWQETPQTGRVLWRYLHEGRAAVIVGTSDFDCCSNRSTSAGWPGCATRSFSGSPSRFPTGARLLHPLRTFPRFAPTSGATRLSG